MVTSARSSRPSNQPTAGTPLIASRLVFMTPDTVDNRSSSHVHLSHATLTADSCLSPLSLSSPPLLISIQNETASLLLSEPRGPLFLLSLFGPTSLPISPFLAFTISSSRPTKCSSPQNKPTPHLTISGPPNKATPPLPLSSPQNKPTPPTLTPITNTTTNPPPNPPSSPSSQAHTTFTTPITSVPAPPTSHQTPLTNMSANTSPLQSSDNWPLGSPDLPPGFSTPTAPLLIPRLSPQLPDSPAAPHLSAAPRRSPRNRKPPTKLADSMQQTPRPRNTRSSKNKATPLTLSGACQAIASVGVPITQPILRQLSEAVKADLLSTKTVLASMPEP